MNRRQALTAVSVIFGGMIVGGDVFLSGCKSSAPKVAGLPFDPTTIGLLDEIAETIIPTTATSPGAKAAALGTFMNTMVKDCYDEKNQKIFIDGINTIQQASDKKFSKTFEELTAAERKTLLTEIDKEQAAYTKSKKKEDGDHYFRLMKQLTIFGYFSSEVGATKALRYLPVPGKYIGDLPYKKGDKAWALS